MDCQKLCRESENCKFWTYNSNGIGTCYRQTKKAPENVQPCDECTRGPKYCTRKHILEIVFKRSHVNQIIFEFRAVIIIWVCSIINYLCFFLITAYDKCPAGYVKLSKSVEPLQLLSEGLEPKIVQTTNPSIDQCASECLLDDTCCIFEYQFDVVNMATSTCKLHKDCELEGTQSSNPIFCKKSKHT